MQHDEQVRLDSIPEEEKRDEKKDKMLANIDMNKIMSSATGVNRPAIEY